MSAHRPKKDHVQHCPGSGFLFSPSKANRTDDNGSSIIHTPGISSQGNNLFKTPVTGGTSSRQTESRDVLNDSGYASTSCTPGFSGHIAGPDFLGLATSSNQTVGCTSASHKVEQSRYCQGRESRDQSSRSRDWHSGSRDRDSRSRDRHHSERQGNYHRGREEHDTYSVSRERERLPSHRHMDFPYDHSSDNHVSASHKDNRTESSHYNQHHHHRDYKNEGRRKNYDGGQHSYRTPQRHSSPRSQHRSRSWRCCQRYDGHYRRNISPHSRRERSRSRDRDWRTRSRNEIKIHTSPEKKELPKPSVTSSITKSHHSVSRLLLNGYQRGEVDRNKMHKRLVLSRASHLQKTDTCDVFPSPGACENLEHMEHMSLNKDHNKLLCMWSVSGTSLQQAQFVNIKHRAKTRCDELPLEFTLSDHVIQTWGSIASLCWADCPELPNSSLVLYAVNHRSRVSLSVGYLFQMDHLTGKIQHVSYMLGQKNVSTCAWNASKQWFAAGLEHGSQVVDVKNRQCWELGSQGHNVFSQTFSKVDGGHLLFSGVYGGSLLMHDIRRDTRKPIVLMNHRHTIYYKSICDLKLSADERYIYTSDISGQIKKWDQRMYRTVLTYEGLCNQNRRLPFHIDDTQSILYAAGTDCYTKIWCLESGELLHSIPPPYEASRCKIPSVLFSSHWAGLAGNIGLVMGAHTDLHLYSSEV